MGWVLGSTCVGISCSASLFRTDDAGKRWTSIPGPPIVDVSRDDGDEVRFANADDGWIVAQSSTAPYPVVWATHNGRSHWDAVTFPAPVANETVSDLEAADGEVYAS